MRALSTNLRVRMLETSDPGATARYVSLTPEAIRLVPADERNAASGARRS